MHDLAPYHRWRDFYTAEDDEQSPFYGTEYSEFEFTKKVYNYYIHPQWDEFGSQTLYLKVLFVDYEEGYAIFEFIGEWNDTIYNDIMFLKRNVIDPMIKKGIYRYILMCENVMNFHGSDDSYYEEWWDDIKEDNGWIAILNTHKHVVEEMSRTQLQFYVNFGADYNDINWRTQKPERVIEAIQALVDGLIKRIF
ncbi:MAG: hypothetical protein ACOYOA_06910 [Saprospiraceae bacterium]